jgi:CarD family transcriptional regulator
MVPRDNCQEVGIREVCSSDDVEGVLEILRTGECSTQGNWSRRFKGNIERLQSGDIFQVAEVVRDLTVRDRDKGLSAGEKRMLQRSRQILVSELVLACTCDEHKATLMLDEALETS